MKTKKIIRYRLGVSRTFPTTHPRKGAPTYFVEKILSNSILWDWSLVADKADDCEIKIHTIRGNYPLWEARMQKVLAGEAVIELFYWTGKPYNSKQVVFETLDKDSGCGVQELGFYYDRITEPFINTPEEHIGYIDKIELFAKNDGMSLDDFKAWFKGYDLHKPMAIIHFTNYRY